VKVIFSKFFKNYTFFQIFRIFGKFLILQFFERYCYVIFRTIASKLRGCNIERCCQNISKIRGFILNLEKECQKYKKILKKFVWFLKNKQNHKKNKKTL